MGKIFYIMGKSASGKDHIYKRLLEDEQLHLNRIVLYTTRPVRKGELPGREYYFIGEGALQKLREQNKVIESRSYDTIHGVWTYCTVDDGQINLEKEDYLGIGTLESYEKLRNYYGKEALCPVYIEVEDGERLGRALKREQKQDIPKYAEMCRRFLADTDDFSEDKILKAGISRRFLNNEAREICIKEIKEYIYMMR